MTATGLLRSFRSIEAVPYTVERHSTQHEEPGIILGGRNDWYRRGYLLGRLADVVGHPAGRLSERAYGDPVDVDRHRSSVSPVGLPHLARERRSAQSRAGQCDEVTLCQGVCKLRRYHRQYTGGILGGEGDGAGIF